MDTCLRGFSFMPENKVEVMDLQYIEGGELSRAWKISRRQRLKELETKIWDQFVKEQDIVSSVCSDDPYQFLEKLPEDCLKELMEAELGKMRKENVKEEPKEMVSVPDPEQPALEAPEPRETAVTFADDSEHEGCDMIHIFDDEKDEELSGPEQEVANDSNIESPCTVRERDSPDPEREESSMQVSEKSSENVRNMIETSIYSAKVKELQSKVNEELMNIITILEAQDLNKIEPQDLPKLQRQCTEFCARYTRIYLYQLKRQIHDITRHNNSALPFARHTFLRTQMTRAVSLYQNILQSLQIFQKWFTQKTPLRECVDCLKSFTQLVRDGDIICPIELHNEEVLQTCQNLDTVGTEYLQKVISFLNMENTSTIRLKKSNAKGTGKKRPLGMWTKPGYRANTQTDAKLSMYSLDTLRVNSKPSSTRDSGCTSKARLGEADTTSKTEDAVQKKKTPRSRRPLMRAPGGVQRKREKPREDSIPTMVEAVEMGTPSHVSREDTPRMSPRDSPRGPSRRSKNNTPRGIRKSRNTSPRLTRSPSRMHLNPKINVTSQELKLALNSVKVVSDVSLSPNVPEKARSPKSGGEKSKSPGGKSPEGVGSPREALLDRKEERFDRENEKDVEVSPSEVSRLLRRLCAGASAGGKNERVSGAKNAQLLCVSGCSPRQPSTPQLLRILEETIQKKIPKPQYSPKPKVKDLDRYRMTFNVTAKAAESLFAYRTKFVQHMLSSPMYANTAVGKPWEMIGSVSEQIIDEMLLACAKEMQLADFIQELYKSETQ